MLNGVYPNFRHFALRYCGHLTTVYNVKTIFELSLYIKQHLKFEIYRSTCSFIVRHKFVLRYRFASHPRLLQQPTVK